MSLSELLHHRRSVRVFDPEKPISQEDVRSCLEMATLAPNSSNMQLWQMIHLVDPKWKAPLTKACLGQSAASTAQQWVVFVTRQDVYRSRAKFILAVEKNNIATYSPESRKAKRIADREVYYGKIMPFLYGRFFRIFGLMRVLMVEVMGLFRPVVREVSESQMRAVVHKSCALAAQTFMLAMTEKGYDTCPMEGFDSKLIKKMLHLPRGSNINMIISCGIRKEEGIWGERCRVPFEEVYELRSPHHE